MRANAEVDGQLRIAEHTVIGILDDEAKKSVSAATRGTAGAVNAAAPVGPTGGRPRKANPSGARLSKSHKASTRRKPHGYAGVILRAADVWYGTVVERGRKAGRARGRRYPAARANPFVDRAAAAREREAEATLDAGADRAAARIEARL